VIFACLPARVVRADRQALRGALAHVVASDLGGRDVASVRSADVEALVAQLRAEGLSSARAAAMLDGLRRVFAYAVGRGLLRASPLVGFAVAPAVPSPTTAIVSLVHGTVVWAVRATFLAFVVVALGLAVAVLA
jgi:site-specific recombinase XerC